MATWGTQDELEFLKKVGRENFGPRRIAKPTREKALRRYRESMDRRTNWGAIDPSIIRTYLALEIGA
ncbi:MAG: hypothetical protein PHV00_06095 [Syntrophales bacterium]|nr:hypothetical protein [Syntrophales bacterium]